ncbi:hypothetical protein Tsubulata_030743 [Turnera subulata]|uniref:Glycine-rich protein n=1 Tax=Turnera subulata TaxID=218843 RepID=A0A9Q0JCV0_9ROSI|nr:hypothetical protein Tsubulata_030743 [Turnera subulata]
MGLLLIFFIYLSLLLSLSQVSSRAFLSDALQEHHLEVANTRSGDDQEQNGASGIVHSSKYGHAAGSTGARGGGGSGSSENGNGNGQSNGGGQAVIPVIVAGAANNRHPNRHSAASCRKNCLRFRTSILAIIASLIVHVYV